MNDSLKVNLILRMNLIYFNPDISFWEPFIEDTDLSFIYQV